MDKIDIKEYREAVETLAANKENWTFENPTREHSNIVISNIFKYAENTIRIYDTVLKGDLVSLYDEYFSKSLEVFLSKIGRKIRILIRFDEDKEADVYKRFVELAKKADGIEIRKATGEAIETIKNVKNVDIRFVFGDKCSYRIERSNGTNSCNTSGKAMCNFNDPEEIEELIDAFDGIFDKCEPLVC